LQIITVSSVGIFCSNFYTQMPVVILVGDAHTFLDHAREHFQKDCPVVVPEGEYASVRSSLANMDERTLYIVTGLSKPERYEIFCLARRNKTQLVSVATCEADGLVGSDRNPLVMEMFDGLRLAEFLARSSIAPTSANRRSKGVCLQGLGSLKSMIDRLNARYIAENGQIECVLRECEERMIKMCSFGLTDSPEGLESCYRGMIETELKRRGIIRG